MNKVLYLIMALLVLNGCAPKLDPSAQALDRAIEKNVEMQERLQAFMDGALKQVMTNSELIMSNALEVAGVLDSMQTEMTERIARIEARLAFLETNRGTAMLRPQPFVITNRMPTAPTLQFKGGVPVTVWNQIFRSAQQKWPGDFNMQEYELNNQIEAYRKLHR